jgi:hypothetical protein
MSEIRICRMADVCVVRLSVYSTAIVSKTKFDVAQWLLKPGGMLERLVAWGLVKQKFEIWIR